MICFMIDLENTGSVGLRGVEYLCPEDYVIIFFSGSSKTIGYGALQKIFASGCKLDICKLANPGKNALDFYIACKTGELFGGGYPGDIAIVSKDKHFQAIRDYWMHCAHPNRHVVVRPNIEQSIVSLNERSNRRACIQRSLLAVSLEDEYARFMNEQQLKQRIKQLFSEPEYAERLEAMTSIVMEHGMSGRGTYLSLLKQFGRKNGLELYHKLKASKAAAE